MDKDELLRMIEQAAKEDWTSLDLSDKELTELPPEIGDLENLTTLNLWNNQLTTFPYEICELTKLTTLSIGGNQLTVLPSEIKYLSNLAWFYVSLNQLTTLPPEIGKLTNLRELGLGVNWLTTLPPEIGDLLNLQEFYLNNNQVTTLPPEIGNLTNLKEFGLLGNQLTKLPKEMEKLTSLVWIDLRGNPLPIPYKVLELTHKPAKIIAYYLKHHKTETETINIEQWQTTVNNTKLIQIIEQAVKEGVSSLNLSNRNLFTLPSEIGKLKNLTWLDLRNNQLTTLPQEISRLKNLLELNLDTNQFTSFPHEITKLSNLRGLELSNNKISIIPPEIGELTNLTRFDLGGNQLTALPPEIGKLINLTRLDLGGNQLAILPFEIGNLTNLSELYVERNRLTSLPHEINKLDLKRFEIYSNRLSIPPEITDLTRQPAKILNYYFQHQKEQKKPLNEAKVVIVGQGAVGKTSLVKQLLENKFDPYETKTEGIDIKQWNVNVPSTSAFSPELDEGFGRTEVRLNVWDFGGQEIMHATHQFFLTKRSLYLLVLDSRLEEQENRVEYWLKIIQSFGGDSPIIVVCNKCDEHDLELNWKGLQEKYPTIKDFAKRISCKTGEGISVLRTLIEREAGQLEHIHDELLLTWFAVKTRLEQMEEDYISYSEYQKMCEAENVFDELSQQTLLGFLHDLGIVLSFHGHYILEDTNVLNPEWVTRGIYQILNSNELFQRKGVLERKALDHILDSNEYPRSKHQFIIDMMRKFELCFDFAESTGESFLVPDLLSKEEPYVGEWDDSLAFHYHYDILPGSVISRFIVRMHTYIFKRTYWRNGVVLVSEDGKNRALVKADIEDKKIFIYVSGRPETRSTFLAIIRADFRKIHASISKLNVKEVIPLPDHPEVEIDYQDLLKLLERGISTYYYPKADAEINVDQVLDSLEPHSTLRKIEGEEQQAHSYFLSYSWNNSNEADHIELVLQRNQRTVLRDESYIEAGGRVSKSVEAMIQKADSFVALWSEQYDQSTWCPNELEYARNRQAKGQKPSRIVLIALDETEVPIRFIDSLRLSGQDRGRREQAIQRLLKEEAV